VFALRRLAKTFPIGDAIALIFSITDRKHADEIQSQLVTESLKCLSLSSNQQGRKLPMPWAEILMLAIGAALIVVMICGRQGA
jgi:hypothetical protein